MSRRHITAVVLLDGSTTQETQRATLAAVAAQTHAPDRIIAVAPSALEDEAAQDLRRAEGRDELDQLIITPAAFSQAGAIREVLDALPASGAADERRSDEQEPGARGEPQDPESAPSAAEPQGDAGAADGGAGPHGRRAADVDVEAVERRRTQELESLAHVPLRLRTEPAVRGRRAAAQDDEAWLWFVLDRALPAEDALAQELSVLTNSPTTAVVGAKRVRPLDLDEDGAARSQLLIDVGITLTHGGRIISGVDPGEIDQGQADWRHDVLAVALPGMLIRESALRGLDGLDAALPSPWAEIDLCHRVWRGGERVAVRPQAHVTSPEPERPLLERLQEQRSGQLLVLLKHGPFVVTLALLVLMPFMTLARMAGATAAVAPRRAAMESRAWVEAMKQAPGVIRRGLRASRRARVPRGRLAPLYLPRADAVRRVFSDLGTRLFADDDRTRRIRRTTWGIAGTRHGGDDADYGRHVVWTVIVALLSVMLGMFSLRRLFGRGDLVGPQLLPLPTSWRDAWQTAWSTWVPDGLGTRGPGDPLLRLLGHLPVAGGTLAEIVVFAAIPVSALTAWAAAGALTRAIGARLALTITWALAPAQIAALSSGAWPMLIVHMALPLLALAIGRAVGLPHKVSQASVSAAAAAGIVLLVVGAVQPVLVVLVAIALALLAPAVAGRRLRLLWVLVPSLALHLPYLTTYIGSPRTLLSAGAMPAASAPPSALDMLMLWPADPGVAEALLPVLGSLAVYAPALAIAPVVIGGVCAPFLAGAAGRAGRLGVLVAALAMLGALLASRTPIAVEGDVLGAAPLHALLDVVLLALALGAGASFDALARREGVRSRMRRGTTALLGAAVAAVCVVAVGGWTLLLPGSLQVERTEETSVPAAAADQGTTGMRTRVLVLSSADGESPEEAEGAGDASAGGGGDVTARLVVHGGDSAAQHSAAGEAREVQRALEGQEVDADPGSTALREGVAALMTTQGTGQAERDVAALALGYVVVPGDLEAQRSLVTTLDSSILLEKVTENSTGAMWRVIDAEGRAVVRGGESPVVLESGAVTARGDIPAEDSRRTLVLSERRDSGWVATVDGTRLAPVTIDGWAQGFSIPPGAEGTVEVHRMQRFLALWQVLAVFGIGITALIAIPWRVRRGAVEDFYG